MEIENFLASFRFAKNTQERYTRILRDLENVPLDTWQPADLIRHISRPGWGDSMRSLAFHAIKKYIRWKFGAGHPALAAQVKTVPTKPQPRMDETQIMELFASFNLKTPKGIRDVAIAAVALDANLRASELCNLEIGNVYLRKGVLYALTKGGQWKWKAFSEETAAYVEKWIEVRQPALGVQTLFVSFHHAYAGKPLKREGLQEIMKQWGRGVGFHISPHMFRRSYASEMTLAGAPKNIVKAGGGWTADKMVDHYIGDLQLETTRPYLPVKKLHGG